MLSVRACESDLQCNDFAVRLSILLFNSFVFNYASTSVFYTLSLHDALPICGTAFKFYSSVRLDIRRIGAIKKGDEIVGNETKVKVVKNKVAPPFKLAHFEILYGEGISREGELIDLGVEHNLIEKAGAWYSYNGDKIGQGKEKVRVFLKENPDIASTIGQTLRDKLLVKPGIRGDDEAELGAVDEGVLEEA